VPGADGAWPPTSPALLPNYIFIADQVLVKRAVVLYAEGMLEPIITLPHQERSDAGPAAMNGQSFSMFEWKGSGPGYLHVHHKDDEAFHVLEGTMKFRFQDKHIEAGPGTTVFIPAGVAHDYQTGGDTRYLIILTPRLKALIEELHTVPFDQHQAVMRKYDSEIVE